MTTPTPDTCALCGNTRAEHKNMERDKRRGFHAFAEHTHHCKMRIEHGDGECECKPRTLDTVEQAARQFCDQFADELLIDKGMEALLALLLQREEAARREGWKAGAEAAAKVADDPRYVRMIGGSTGDALGTALGIAAAIRALPETKKE
jgi:hypothetical protein